MQSVCNQLINLAYYCGEKDTFAPWFAQCGGERSHCPRGSDAMTVHHQFTRRRRRTSVICYKTELFSLHRWKAVTVNNFDKCDRCVNCSVYRPTHRYRWNSLIHKNKRGETECGGAT